MPRCFPIFTLLAVLPISTMAFAAQQQRSGTPDEQKACTRDVERFCRSVMDKSEGISQRALAELLEAEPITPARIADKSRYWAWWSGVVPIGRIRLLHLQPVRSLGRCVNLQT